MMKLIGVLTRKDGLSHEEFVEYWMEEHVPIARELEGLRKYTTAVPIDPGTTTYDGIAELYFDTVEDFETVLGYGSDTAAAKDVENFIGARERHLVNEQVHLNELDDPESAVKYVGILDRKPDWTQEEFVDYWLDEHVPVATELPGLLRYSTNVPIEPEKAENDGVAELYFGSYEEFDAALGEDRGSEAARRSREDGARFIGDLRKLVVTESVHVDTIV